VVIASGEPWRFSAFFMNLSAAALSRSLVACKQWTEPVPPVAHRLMADVDAALGQQVFDVPEAERVLHVQQHRQADHLRRAVEVAEGTGWDTRTRHGSAPTLASLPEGAFALTMPHRPIRISQSFGGIWAA
jgi:hypothetical protein